MTTIISRLYDSQQAAQALRDALLQAGHDPATISVLQTLAGTAPEAADLADAGIGWRSAQALAEAMPPGGAVVVVRAPFVPFGRALGASRLADSFGPLQVPGAIRDQHVPDRPDPRIFHPTITAHTRWLTRDMPPFVNRRRGTVSSAFGLGTLWRRRPLRVGSGRSWLARLFGPALWRRRPWSRVGAGRPLLRLRPAR